MYKEEIKTADFQRLYSMETDTEMGMKTVCRLGGGCSPMPGRYRHVLPTMGRGLGPGTSLYGLALSHPAELADASVTSCTAVAVAFRRAGACKGRRAQA